VKNVLVLISSANHPALNDGAIRCAVDVLRAQGATVGAPDWLAPDVACDIPFDGPSAGVAMTALDGVVVPAAGRRKKLLVADMESTMIENEMLDELADFLGLREKIAGITARAMNGEIDFAAALDERVGLLKGLPIADTLSVGDGANDLPMLKASGLGVAFHAKPVVAAEVSARIDHGDLTALLYLQGYRRTDFVERNDP